MIKEQMEKRLEALSEIEEKMQELKRASHKLLAEAFALYYHKEPDAILFVVGQIGEYSDEGYSGVFVARIDPGFVKQKFEELSDEQKKRTRWSEESRKGYTKAYLKGVQEGSKSLEVPVNYGYLANEIRVKDLDPFIRAQSCCEIMDSIGDSNRGRIWFPDEKRQLFSEIGFEAGEINSVVDKDLLLEKVPKEVKKRVRKPKTL
jgi:hypothetical protein